MKMSAGLEIIDRSLVSRLADALLFFLPTCLVFYLVAFQFKHYPGEWPSAVAHWCLIVGALALCVAILYRLLHTVRYTITHGTVLRTERKFLLFKSSEAIPGDDIAGVTVEVGKNSFTGSPRYALVLRLKSGRVETITTSLSEQGIRRLQASFPEALGRNLN